MSNIVSSANDISLYINEVNKIPLLSEEEEISLATAFQNNGCRISGQKLVLSHLKLVIKLALHYRNYGATLQDLISEGNIGLMHAVKKFKTEMGCRLSTYASWWIRSAMQEFILKSWSLLKINASALKKKLFYSAKNMQNRIKAVNADTQQVQNSILTSQSSKSHRTIQQGNSTATHALPAATNTISSAKAISDADSAQIDTRYMLSIDSSDGGCGDKDFDPNVVSNISDGTSCSQESALIDKEDSTKKLNLLRMAVNSLTKREKVIISRRRLQQKADTLKALSDDLGISPERVRQIEQIAMKKMQSFISAHP